MSAGHREYSTLDNISFAYAEGIITLDEAMALTEAYRQGNVAEVVEELKRKRDDLRTLKERA